MPNRAAVVVDAAAAAMRRERLDRFIFALSCRQELSQHEGVATPARACGGRKRTPVISLRFSFARAPSRRCLAQLVRRRRRTNPKPSIAPTVAEAGSGTTRRLSNWKTNGAGEPLL